MSHWNTLIYWWSLVESTDYFLGIKQSTSVLVQTKKKTVFLWNLLQISCFLLGFLQQKRWKWLFCALQTLVEIYNAPEKSLSKFISYLVRNCWMIFFASCSPFSFLKFWNADLVLFLLDKIVSVFLVISKGMRNFPGNLLITLRFWQFLILLITLRFWPFVNHSYSVLYISILIDSKPIVRDSSVVFTENFD